MKTPASPLFGLAAVGLGWAIWRAEAATPVQVTGLATRMATSAITDEVN